MLKTIFRCMFLLVGGHTVLQSAAIASDATLTTDVVEKAAAQARENDMSLLGNVKHAIGKDSTKVPRELLPVFTSLLRDENSRIQQLGLVGLHRLKDPSTQSSLIEYVKQINPRKLEAEQGADPSHEPEYSRAMLNAATAVLLLGDLADESAIPFLQSLRGIRDLKLEWSEDVTHQAITKIENRLGQREGLRRLLDDVNRMLDDLRKAKTLQGYRSDSLTVQWAILRYRDQPEEALAVARVIKEPFYASLALGGISVLRLENDPDKAKDLFLEAQERALQIDHWTGSDATSLAYLFEVIPLFDSARAKSLLTASRKNLQRWTDDEHRKSRAMAALSRATIAVDPSGVDDLLQEVSTSPQSNHYFESVQLLGRFLARSRKQWAAKETDQFYQSRDRWPFSFKPLSAVLLEDAIADLAKARARIEGLPDNQQDQARLAVAQALQEASRTDEALTLLDEVDARTKAKVTQASWVRDLARKFRTLWTAEKVRAVSAEEVDRFLRQPELSGLRGMVNPTRLVVFRDGEQVGALVAAALPLVRRMKEESGFPHHGSPRSVLLGMLARIRAMQQDLERAEAIAGEITIPKLQAFYLMEACEVSRPLPGVLRGWPIYFYPRTEIRIGA